MNHMLIPPREPGHEPVRPPMIYIEKKRSGNTNRSSATSRVRSRLMRQS